MQSCLEHSCRDCNPKQSYWILRYKPPHPRIVIPKRVVVQPRLIVKILPLKPQILLDIIDRQPFNSPPSLVRRLPDNLPFTVSHLQRSTNLIGMEVIELLLFPSA